MNKLLSIYLSVAMTASASAMLVTFEPWKDLGVVDNNSTSEIATLTTNGVTFSLSITCGPGNLKAGVATEDSYLGVVGGVSSFRVDNLGEFIELSLSVSGATLTDLSLDNLLLRNVGLHTVVFTDGSATNTVSGQQSFDYTGIDGDIALTGLSALSIANAGGTGDGSWSIRMISPTGEIANNFQLDTITLDYTLDTGSPEAPVANDDSYDVEQNTISTNAAPGVLANDTDANSDPLTAILLSSPTNGTLISFSADGSFIYQPNTGFTGTDSFTYQATDGGLTGNVATVTLNVSGTPLQLPHHFQDNMVLQRNKPIPVWGWGPVGETVNVTLSSGQATNTVIDANGRWETTLAAMVATNGPLSLTMSIPGSSITLTNLAVGDVWFCSGQSNAGWSLSATDGGDEEMASANYPNFRLIRVMRYAREEISDDPLNPEESFDWDPETDALKDKAGNWFSAVPAEVGDFGAVFYYAGKELHLNLNIPIGIIQSAYAGTPVEAWTTTPVPEEHPPGSDPADPRTLYNGMVYPYLRSPVTGFCWYQGERNHDDGGHVYADKLSILIDDWRIGWDNPDLPFYYIQIPPVFEWDTEAEADPMLPYFWEAQTLVEKTVSNAYMVVSSDTTTGILHPKNKRPVGERVGRRMLKNTYGFSSIQDEGPVFTHAVVEGGSMRLYFAETGGGLMLNTNIGFNANGDYAVDYYEDVNFNGILDTGEDRDKDDVLDIWGEDLNQNGVMDPGEDLDGDGILDLSEWKINFTNLTWFELCSADGTWTNADAVIDGDTVVVTAATVPNPVGVRYAWSRFAQGNLMNAEGLPARLFRQVPPIATDDQVDVFYETMYYLPPDGILGNDLIASSLQPFERPLLETGTTNGAVVLRSDGAFIYTPNAGFTGTDAFSYSVTDGIETSETAQVELSVLPPGAELGSITRDIWNDVPGYTVDDLVADPDYPDNPDVTETLDSFDSPHGNFEGGGQRIHGYLHPPASGNYTFWITSAARSRLFLSTDADPANTNLICECAVSLGGEYENWTNNANQVSAPITLIGGQRYYIMALHNEGAEDHCSVAWNLDGTTNIIDGAHLSPFTAEAPTVNDYTGWSDWYGVSGDGHVLDFAFNLDPTLDAQLPVMVPTTGTAGLPCWELDSTDGLIVEYLRRTDAPGTAYAVQFSDNLASNWVDSVAAESVSPVNDEWERVVVEDETDTADATNRFGRVIVIQD